MFCYRFPFDRILRFFTSTAMACGGNVSTGLRTAWLGCIGEGS